MEGLQPPTEITPRHEDPAASETAIEHGAPEQPDGSEAAALEEASEVVAEGAAPPLGGDPFALPRLVEAILFTSDSPLTAARIAACVEELTPAAVKQCIATLNAEYEAAGRTFRIEHIARGYQMLTMPEYQPWLAKATQQRADTRMTDAAMETLAIVAYRQPVIRADVESVRGVACGDQLNRLRELGLVKIVGRADVVGRPMLYGTTRKFLDVFGLGDLRDLPPMEEFGLAASPQVVTRPLDEVEPVAPPAHDGSPLERGETEASGDGDGWADSADLVAEAERVD